jgi:transcriptional regulator with XRE-family HTH domain
MDIEHAHIGRRIREIRTWRKMTLSATAGLTGLSVSYLSMIERGQRAVTKRSVLEALARALRVAPVQLTVEPDEAQRTVSEATTARFTDILSGWWIGEVPDAPCRPLPELLVDVRKLAKATMLSDYATQAEMSPLLIRELLVAASRPDVTRSFR